METLPEEEPTVDLDPKELKPKRPSTNMWDALIAMIMLIGVIWLVQFLNANSFDKDELVRGGQTTVAAVVGYFFQYFMAKKRNNGN